MPSSSHPADEGWVKIFFDPPYNQPRTIEHPSGADFAIWRRLLAQAQYADRVTLWTNTMIVYDTRNTVYEYAHKGRIIIAVKR